jgi:acyl-coenzyme A thioesterase PaaI-like protein
MSAFSGRPAMPAHDGMGHGAFIGHPPPGDTLERLRSRHHPRCFVAREEGLFGLGVHFAARPDSSVEATVSCPASWEGYPGLVHGGIIASLLDGAMTNALFARGTVAVTAEAKIRYWHPLPLGRSATVLGAVAQCEPPLYIAEARITSSEGVHATCTAKFMRVADRPRQGGTVG